MSMRNRAEEYLAMRRSLGYQLRVEGRMLLDFADRLDSAGQPTITVAAAVAWACQPTTSEVQRCRRLGVVRGFARHLHAIDPTCEVPPTNLLVSRSHRPTPYLYSSQEIAALIHAAGTITAPLLAVTMQVVISLIAATGLRLGEALALDRGNVDLTDEVLTVTGKNGHTHPADPPDDGRDARVVRRPPGSAVSRHDVSRLLPEQHRSSCPAIGRAAHLRQVAGPRRGADTARTTPPEGS